MYGSRFFNAHCHLELGHLRGAVRPGLSFTDWIAEIVRLKRERTRLESVAAVAAGLAEMRDGGIHAFLDIDSLGTSIDAIRAVQEPAISFTEVIDFDPALGAYAVTRALERQQSHGPLAPGQAFGLSPHAPYSTSPRLLRAAALAAGQTGQWLAMHAGETPEETEMLVHGRGPLFDFLQNLRLIPPRWKTPGLRPIPYLAEHGILGPSTLLIHVNEVNGEEAALLRDTGTRVAVCPGTHVYFNRGEFPLRRLLEAGVEVYLGTDSLASNEALSMEREIDIACELTPGVDRRDIAALAAIERAADFGLNPRGSSLG